MVGYIVIVIGTILDNMFESIKKIWGVLTKNEQKYIFFVAVLMMLTMFLEALSIGLLYPLISGLLGNDMTKNLDFFPELFLIQSTDDFIFFVGVSFIAVFIIKIIYSIFFNYYQSKVIANIHNSLVDRLFNNYLHRDYFFHISNNSALLFRNITFEVNQFVSALASILVLLAESLQLLGVIGLVLIVEPIGGVISYLFIIFSGYIFIKFTTRRVRSWGGQRQSKDGEKLVYIQETLGAIKEVILMHKQEYFAHKVNIVSRELSVISAKERFIQNLPKIWVEFVTLLAGLILAFFTINSGNASSALPILGLFAAASFRAMPSVNKILTNYHNFNYSTSSINVIANDFERTNLCLRSICESPNNKFMSVKLSELCYAYPDCQVQTLNKVTFSVNRGDIIGIVGESGAGKSTLINIFLGLLQPTTGGIYVDGENINDDLCAWQSRISYVPQQINLIDDSIARNVAFGLEESQIDYEKVNSALKIAQLFKYVDQLPGGSNSKVGQNGISLSGGQRQRLGIARAVYFDAEILVLDEATSSLDTDTEKEFIDAINAIKNDLTILIVAHRLSTLSIAGRIIKVVNGGVVEVCSLNEIEGL